MLELGGGRLRTWRAHRLRAVEAAFIDQPFQLSRVSFVAQAVLVPVYHSVEYQASLGVTGTWA